MKTLFGLRGITFSTHLLVHDNKNDNLLIISLVVVVVIVGGGGFVVGLVVSKCLQSTEALPVRI